MRQGGRPARLGPAELSRPYTALLEGAPTYGFGAPRWTLKRVRPLIERDFGVRWEAGSTYGGRFGQLGLSNQTPDRPLAR